MTHNYAFEPERYELSEGPRYRFTLSRRAFLQVVGGGLLITTFGGAGYAQGGDGGGGLSGRIHIGEDGAITVYTGKVQVGQGSRTQISQAAAEELHVPLDHVKLVMADTDIVPDDGGTYGSLTTPRTLPDVRQAAASARELLEGLAAEQWDAEPAAVSLQDGVFQHNDGRSMTLAELVAKAQDLEGALAAESPGGAELTPVPDWRVMGTSPQKLNGADVVTGRHEYPSDITREGMVYGKVLRPPTYDAKLAALELEAAQALDGVQPVHDGDFAGCTAPTSWQAAKGVEKLAQSAKWEEQDSHPSSDGLFALLKETAQEGSGRHRSRSHGEGDVEAAFSDASEVLRAAYRVPYIQHAPMEPRAAVAEWDGGKLTVWTGTQRPFGVRSELARAFGMPEEQVRVVVPDTGGGFGGKHTGECAIEAARLAKAAGKPVSLQWTREEEFTWAYFRPAGLLEAAASFDANGAVTGWDFTNYNSGSSGIDCPYTFPNKRIRFQNTESPLRQGSYRALAATANNFAREAFIDRLARKAGQDPLAFRLANLEDQRLKDVLNAAADAFGWEGRSQNGGVGHGIACGAEKGSVVATCTEVAVDEKSGKPEIKRITTAFECGPVVNPKNLQAQIEGAIVMGLGAVLREEIRFEDGKILNKQFKTYKVPRFKDVPPMETVVLDRPNLPMVGAGETPIIALAPAVANAMLDATGHAPESLPLRGVSAKG